MKVQLNFPRSVRQFGQKVQELLLLAFPPIPYAKAWAPVLRFSLICFLISWLIVPVPQFEDPTSTVVEDYSGDLLGARIAADGQWRFPETDTVPAKFEACILTFEDQQFYCHPGINPWSLARAMKHNIQAGKVVEGGSTLTMQLARLMRKGQRRTYTQKVMEIVLALHFEVNWSKAEILKAYAAHAPYGGNVVGLEAAAWRYYGRSPGDLSWAESAALAVLPNAPALIYPGKNQIELERKRNFLLGELYAQGTIDSLTWEMSLLEPLPGKPLPLPETAPHAVDRMQLSTPGERTRTTIEAELQASALDIVNQYTEQNAYNEIHNAAAMIIDVKTGSVISYVGNATGSDAHANEVDVIRAPRSTGSILKPFLYASMLTSGELLPQMLVEDVPTQIAGYSPKNYYLNYDGAVHADEALYRSLNVPFVLMLQQYGVERFYQVLTQLGLTTLNHSSDHYGLSLMLGGAEANLFDLASAYAGMARSLNTYNSTFHYDTHDFRPAVFVEEETTPGSDDYLFSASAIYQTFEALTQVNRPNSESGWKSFSSARKVGWKTGTSFGNRDAWAVGVTPEYVVAVWVGNADGEGRPGLTGVNSAAPVMFDLFNLLPASTWFDEPYEDEKIVSICRASGYKASVHCDQTDELAIPNVDIHTGACPFHRKVHVSPDGRYQVDMDCENRGNMVHRSWFVLPPVQEFYFKVKSPMYTPLPPVRSDCNGFGQQFVMETIYPKDTRQIFIPKELDGSGGRVVFEVAHRNPGKKIYWHLDGDYLGESEDFHQMAFSTQKGDHEMVIMDEDGNELRKRFLVVSE